MSNCRGKKYFALKLLSLNIMERVANAKPSYETSVAEYERVVN
jgi:hypothetical protein